MNFNTLALQKLWVGFNQGSRRDRQLAHIIASFLIVNLFDLYFETI